MRNFTAGLCAVTVLVAGCGGADPGATPEPDANLSAADPSARVETLILVPDVFEDVIEITGDIESVNDAVLSAESAGTVQMLARLGQHVTTGTVVARLDQGMAQPVLEQAEASLENAEASLTLAEDSYNRMKPLHRDSIISALEFREVDTRLLQARATVRQAKAGRAQAQEQLDNTLVRAPFAGTIEEHRVMVGEQVAPGSPVIRIVDARRVKIAIGVPERYAGDIAVGSSVEMYIPALENFRRKGRVTFAGNPINPKNRTFAIEAEVDNVDGRMKPKMIAHVFISRQRLEDVLIIPRVAVVRDEDGSNVYIVDRSSDPAIAKRKGVRLGAIYAERVIVEEGLTAGDEVVVLGQSSLTEGTVVEVSTHYHRLDKDGIPVTN